MAVPSGRNASAESQNSIQPPKSVAVKILGIFFFLIGLPQYFIALLPFIIFFMLDRTMSSPIKNFVPGYMFRTFPSVPLLFIPLSILPVILIYAGLKLFDGSKKSWLLSLVSFIAVPPLILLLYTIFLLLITIGLGFETLNDFLGLGPVKILQTGTIGGLIEWGFVLFVFIILKNKFTLPEKPLSFVSKLILIILFIITVFPITFYVVSGKIAAADKDLGRSNAQKQAKFRLHLPTTLPQDYEQITKVIYGNPKREGWEESIKVMYAPTLSADIKGWREGAAKTPIVLSEKDAAHDLNLEQYVKENYIDKNREETKLEMVDVKRAKSGKGYAGEFGILHLYVFVTSDDTLVEIMSPKKRSTLSDLQIIAESLD